MSFADSMDDLEAMNDPLNTAESMAARHSAAKPGRIKALFAWMRWKTKLSRRRSPTPQKLAQHQVTADLDQAMGARSPATPAADRKVS